MIPVSVTADFFTDRCVKTPRLKFWLMTSLELWRMTQRANANLGDIDELSWAVYKTTGQRAFPLGEAIEERQIRTLPQGIHFSSNSRNRAVSDPMF